MPENFTALPLKLARPGLTLEQNVLDHAGRLVIAKGTRLTPMLLSRLVKWNIPEIFIPEAEAQALLADNPETRESAPVPPDAPRAPESPDGKALALSHRKTQIVAVGHALSEEGVKLAEAVERELDTRFGRVLEKPLMNALREAARIQLVNPDARRRLPGRR